MKKFLVFVILCIVTLSIGLTTYYFISDNDVFIVNGTYYEVNVLDNFTIDMNYDLSGEGKVIFESLHPEVVEYNPGSVIPNSFVALSGGRAVIRISTTNNRFSPVTIEVEVGDGTYGAPLFISNAQELSRIGKDINKPMDAYYTLRNNIDLAAFNNGEWLPLGADLDEAFEGNFDFGDNTIYNLNVVANSVDREIEVEVPVEGGADGETTTETQIQTYSLDHAGLFYKLGENAVVKNLVLDNTTIEGLYEYAGAIAGTSAGVIERVSNLDGSIESNNLTAKVGGIVGAIEVLTEKTPRIDRVFSLITVEGQNYVGGLVGESKGGIVINSFADSNLIGHSTSTVGGLVGHNTYTEIDATVYESKMKDCYFTGSFTAENSVYGALVGLNSNYDELQYPNEFYGLYYSPELTGATVTALGGVEDTELPNEYGVYAKTWAELQDEATYFSYTNLQNADISWFFGKVWDIDMNINSGLPFLNMNGPKVDDGFTVIGNDSYIYDIADLQGIVNDMTATYILKSTISLSSIDDWQPIGTTENPFEGKLYASDGFTITDLTITSNNLASGLFGVIGPNGGVFDLTLEDVSVVGGQNVGGIAGINNGIIENCKVLTVNNDPNYMISGHAEYADLKVGGIAGDNLGTIENCVTDIDIKPVTTNTKNAHIGAIAGSNLGSIIGGYSDSNIVELNNEPVYIGGIAGYNKGLVESIYYTGDVTANTNASKTLVGGLVGFNALEGVVRYSSAEICSLEGYSVGGLVGITKGLVQECYSGAINIAGRYVGGLAFNIAQGQVKDSHSFSFLNGVSTDSVLGGFAYFIEYHGSTYGEVINCFSSATFGPQGERYVETYAPVRSEITIGFDVVPRQAGYIVDSIYDRDIAPATAKSQGQQSFFNTNWFIEDEDKEVSVSTDHAKGLDGNNWSTFTKENFKSSVWERVEGEYMQLINVVRAPLD